MSNNYTEKREDHTHTFVILTPLRVESSVIVYSIITFLGRNTIYLLLEDTQYRVDKKSWI